MSTPLCAHCRTPLPSGRAGRFCCSGCEEVAGLLLAEGLDRYYALRGDEGVPATVAVGRSHQWLEPLVARARGSEGLVAALELDVQGLHCAACVWLMNELFRKRPGQVQLTVNPALGKARLCFEKTTFDVAGFVRDVERFGYSFGPSRKQSVSSRELPLRLGICAALTMNVMLFSVSFYVGLAPADGEAFALFTRLSIALSSAVVLVGGWPFFKAALAGLRRGILHLDLPIAVGILLVYGTSLLQARDGRGDLAYFDTLNTFVTLMLVGRWLQTRLLEKNRRHLLEDDGAEDLTVRRERGADLEVVPATRVRAGDTLVIAPGELVPVDAQLLDLSATVSTEWVNGESGTHAAQRGGTLNAGSFNAGASALRVTAQTDFVDSPLLSLLRAPADPTTRRAGSHTGFWNALASRWVLAVLGVSALGFFLWLPAGMDRALQVTVALLVVTCPCAIGLAGPLGYELTLARLRRLGFFARSVDVLDRLWSVRKVIFDKTGTLTLGRLELSNPGRLTSLEPDALNRLYDLTSRSNHPVSKAIARSARAAGARYDPAATVEEVPGKGVQLTDAGASYRLGARPWALATGDRLPTSSTVLSRNGVELLELEVRDSVRPDALREAEALESAGVGLFILSGDAPARVSALARELSIPDDRALGALSPEQKAQQVERIGADDALYLGDGVNDSLAFERSHVAGTPAIDRPVMPGRSDFFLLGDGLAPVRQALCWSRTLRAVVRRNLAVSVAYNVVAISVCLAGGMTPLVAAIAMPASSLSIVLLTLRSLAGGPAAGTRDELGLVVPGAQPA